MKLLSLIIGFGLTTTVASAEVCKEDWYHYIDDKSPAATIEALKKENPNCRSPNPATRYTILQDVMSATWSHERDARYVEYLLKMGANPNARDEYGRTPLMKTSRADIIQLLIDAGANVNVKDEKGRTPLMYAADTIREKSADGIIALLKAGADLHATGENGETALHYAGFGNNGNVINALIEAGIDVNVRNDSGNTPLHYAVFKQQYSITSPLSILALLEAGADVSIENNEVKTPWDYAKKNSALKETDAYWVLNEARFE